jgi:hypothetical protein
VLKIRIVLLPSRNEASPQFATKGCRFSDAPIVEAMRGLTEVLTAILNSQQGLSMLQWIMTPRGPTKEVR